MLYKTVQNMNMQAGLLVRELGNEGQQVQLWSTQQTYTDSLQREEG